MGDFTKHLWIRRFFTAPAGWACIETVIDGVRFEHETEPVRVLVTGSRELDGKRWVHLSISRPDRAPTISELRDAKFAFLGDRKAVQIFPSREEYVNIHPNCLHVFACVDGDPFPDFTQGSSSI